MVSIKMTLEDDFQRFFELFTKLLTEEEMLEVRNLFLNNEKVEITIR